MDSQVTKKLNKQGVRFAILHSVFIINIIVDIIFIH
ncbi:hypothetical protein SAMN05518872_104293 [Psychrobacillus sp. OK032]|nr:hypothetical protein SAMN05518872_104293 [Psychrobacillus sp. OK032]